MPDEQYYAQALSEFESGHRDAALIAKAYALARGDENAQKFEYIKLRVQKLRAEHWKNTSKNQASKWKSQAIDWWPASRQKGDHMDIWALRGTDYFWSNC